MNTPPLNDIQKQALLREASLRLGASPDELTAAIERGDAAALKSRLSPAGEKRLNELLADEAAMKTLLARPELQELLRAWDGKG